MKTRFLNELGYGMIEIMLVASLVGVIPITVYLEAEKSARSVDCLSNLRNIYMALQMYEMDYERLPDAKFYPESPKDDPRSIVNILSNYIDDKKVFICPSMPSELAAKSLTYVWNDSYNNKFIDSVSNKEFSWLMTDMTAVDPKIPPPHQGAYNVIFVDGHAESVKESNFLTPTLAKSILLPYIEYDYASLIF
ncbi:MAG: hypothetical protein PHI59_01135 [Candidatus Omnitrophica bacterium]|nr:hypothetical protein [Candidatus Omnitrophota bacterium]